LQGVRLLPVLPEVLVEVIFNVTWKHLLVESAPCTAVP
jgi:hypothetical protein